MALDDYFIEHIIGDAVAGFSAARLPALPEGMSYQSVPQEGATAEQTDYFKALMIRGARRAAWQYVIARANALLQDIQRHQYLLHLMSFASVPPIYTIYAENGNSVLQATYLVTDVTGGVVTCKFQTGNVDPHAAADPIFNENPEWLGPGTETGGRLIASSVIGKLKPGGGVRFNTPSVMAGHGSVRVTKIEYPGSNPTAHNAEFKFYTDSNIGSMFLQLMPGESGSITATYTQWAFRFYEGWQEVILADPLYCTRQFFSTQNLSTEHVIFEGRFRPWQDDSSNTYLQIFRHLVSDPATGIDVTNTVKPLMTINHSGANGYQTTVNLASTGWGAETLGIVFVAYVEDAGDDAVCVGCNQRCKHSKYDFTGSTGGHYCERAATASGYGQYKENCMLQNICDAFETDFPSAANDAGFLKQLIASTPQLFDEQPYPGIPFAWLRRNAPPGLQDFFALNLTLPILYEGMRYPVGRPQWQPYTVETDENDDQYFADVDGLEQGFADGVVRATAWSGKANGFALGGSNDPYEAMAVENSPDVDPFEYDANGKYGSFQRSGADTWHFTCRVPPAGSIAENRVTVTRGLWNANLIAVENEGDAIYDVLVALDKNIDLYNKSQSVHGGLKTTAVVVAQTAITGGYKMELKNKVVSMTSFIGSGENLSTDMRLGGTNVRCLNAHTVNNKYAWVSQRGNMRNSFAQVGDCIYHEDIGVRMPVKTATPFGGNASGQSWMPDENIHQSTFARPYHFVAFASEDETLSTITITRASGTVTLTGENEIDYHREFAKDIYLYYVKNYNGQKGVLLEFSKNQTNTTDYLLDYTIVTDADTYTGAINLATDWNANCIITMTNANHDYTGVESITLQWRDTFGVFHEVAMSRRLTLPTSAADLADDEYYLVETSAREWTFYFPTNLFGAEVKIRLAMESFYGTEQQFFDGYISPLHDASAPALRDMEDMNIGDTIDVVDENGLWAALGVNLVGETIEIRTDSAAHWLDAGITVEARLDDPEATPLSQDNYKWFGAEGRVYIEKNICDVANSVWLALPLADRNCMMKAAALQNILTAEKKLLEG